MSTRDKNADWRARQHWRPTVDSGQAICPRCQQPITPGEPWDVGHADDLVLGGHPRGATRPEHASCNRSAGAVLAARGRRRLRTESWLA